MKKMIALLLALGMCLSLWACSSENPYEAYKEIFDLLDDGEYDEAISLIEDMKDPDGNGEENTRNPGESSETSSIGSSVSTGTANLEEPDEDTKALLNLYNSIAGSLGAYDPKNTFYIYTFDTGSLYGQNALRFCYETLQELECLDEWLARGYAQEGVNADRRALLNNFTKVPNVLLTATATTEDQMGNVDTKGANVWHYDAEGKLILYTPDSWGPYGDLYEIYGYKGYDHEISYDEKGRISSIKIVWPVTDDTTCVVTPTYDANGRKTSEAVKTNNGTVTYTYSYDNQGRLIRIEMPAGYGPNYSTLTYSYDGAGNLQKKVLAEYITSDGSPDRMYTSVTTDYTWKAGICSATVTTSDWNAVYSGGYNYTVSSETVDVVTYEYENGRAIREITEFGATVYTNSSATQQPSTVCKTVDIVYGDYYCYKP